MVKVTCLACFRDLTGFDNIFSCSKKHHFCAPCGKSLHLQCQCDESLQLLTVKNVEGILDEIECLGNSLNIWDCNWSGRKQKFYEHFIRSHNNIEIFSQFQVSSVPFRSDQMLSAMTLVKAFESNFVFYYHANPSVEMIYFLIFLLDEKEQVNPESFLYEFMIKSPKENHWKTKYVEKCFVLNDDITHLRDNELCAAITYRSIQKYLYEGHIHFSFLIKKTSKDLNVAIKASEGSKKETGKKKPKPYKADNKGCLKGNNVRKAPSIPDVKPSAADIIKKDIVVEVDSSKNQPPDYSSINRHNNGKQFASPVHATEAMKRNDVELLLLQQGGTRTDECYHFPNIMCQSYKSPDHKLYRQKYPSCCLSKPILKK